MRFLSALWVLPALLVGCGSASTISLSVQMTDEMLEVKDSAFGAALSGSFKLRLELGSEASGSTRVTPGNFELQTEAGEFIADLRDAKMDPEFPVDLNKGESKQVLFTLADVDVDRAQACPGPLRIVGSVMDTAKGETNSVRSASIAPDCK
jgi:hypothetical protein